jgi:AraC-like DNA-binding protein
MEYNYHIQYIHCMTNEESILNQLPRKPKDYYQGVCSEDKNNPQEIVMFLRKERDFLQIGEPIVHQRFNLIVNLGGEGIISLDFHDITLYPGQALLVFPYQLQIFKETTSSSIAWGFTGFDLEDYSRLESLRYQPVHISSRAMESYKFALEHYRIYWKMDILSEVQSNTDPSLIGIYHDAMLRELLLNSPVLIDTVAKREIESIKGFDGEKKSFIRQMKVIIWNSGTSLTNEQMADNFGLSVSALHKKCIRILDLTPGQFVMKVRMGYASHLLSDSALTIAQISIACDFKTAGNFSRSFKSYFNKTPREYRNSK